MVRHRNPKQLCYLLTVLAIAVVVLPTLNSGCEANEEPDLPNDRLWESAHFRYHTRSGDDGACEAVLDQLERHFTLMQDYLGFPWPTDLKVDYYKFLDKDDYFRNSECPNDSDSCARDSAIFSPHPLQDHELVHAYLAPLGFPPAFFVEGIASVLACDEVFTLGDPEPWQDVVAVPFDDDGPAYFEGPWFVGYLLHHYGAAPFLLLYDSLDYRSASLDEISSAFESVYGETLDAAWTAALASGTRVRCVNLWNCNGPALSLDGSLQTLAQACDGSDQTRTFALDAKTDVIISSIDYFLYAPLSCDEDLPYYEGGDDFNVVYFPAIVPMTPGKYFIRAYGTDPDQVGIRALPSKSFSKDCTEIEPVDLSAAEFDTLSEFELSIPNDASSWYVKLHPASNRSLYPGSDGVMEECIGCGDPPICQPFEYVAHPDGEGNVTLRITSTTSGPGYVTYYFQY